MKQKFLVAFSSALSLAAFAQAAGISDVSIRQRWPWSQKVDISYSLSATGPQDVSLTLYSNGARLKIPSFALSGDRWNVAPGGPRTITLDPSKTIYTNEILTDVRAEVSIGSEPLYMIFDLTKTYADADLFAYLSAEDLASGDYGPTETNKWSENGVPPGGIIWTGITNFDEYATTKLVLRRIHAGSFTMGESNATGSVTLTTNFWMSVYPITHSQFAAVVTNAGTVNATDCKRAKTNVSCYYSDPMIRNGNWPGSGYVFSPILPAKNSFVHAIRRKTSQNADIIFDLPTEAQWEYACRAGSETYYYDGLGTRDAPGDASNPSAFAVYGVSSALNVGSRAPNAWGLYDMCGLTYEWVQNFYTATPSFGEDPVGPTQDDLDIETIDNGSHVANSPTWGARVWRGGPYNGNAGSARVSNRIYHRGGVSGAGFRIVLMPKN